jgi:4-aminobutyrate aminotransferase/(S)-3-amino-2-methylpropionate transaminase
MEEQDAVSRYKHIESLMWSSLEAMRTKYDTIGDIRGRGGMIAIEFVKPGTDDPDADRTGRVARYCHERGVLVLTAGTYGNVIRFLPPMSISDELLREGLDILDQAIAATA